MQHDHSNCEILECEICRHKIPFVLPEELINDLIDDKAVIFSGAGISTENHIVFPNTFYETIRNEIDIQPENNLSFPDLMSEYCAQRNGRSLLLQKIKQRFDYIKGFPELYRTASRFHRELATLFFINSIFTTNWDDYFECECGALPIVAPEDFAFWNLPGRKVFKIHGSVNSYSSIIATREDYEHCYEKLKSGLIGSYLKVILATKTIIYIGFSFRDDDFLRIYKFLSEEMGEIRPCSYIVTIDQSSEARFTEHGLIPIYTDGEYFIKTLKQELINRKLMVDDKEFAEMASLLDEVSILHTKMWNEIDISEQPDAIYSFSYQDGLIHSLERILALRNTGYYSNPCNVHKSISSYVWKRKEILKDRRYFDIAYIDGYLDGLIYFIADHESRKSFSPLYVFGYKGEIQNFEEYKQIIPSAFQIHKSSHKLAEKFVKDRIIGKDITFHHPPFL